MDDLIESDSTEPVPEMQKPIIISNIHEEITMAFRFDKSTSVLAMVDGLLSDLRRKQEIADMDILSTEIDEMESMRNTVVAQGDIIKERVSEFILERKIRYSTINRLNEKITERVKLFNEALKFIYDTLCSIDDQMDDVVRSYDDFVIAQEFDGANSDGQTAVIDQIREQVNEVSVMVSSIVDGVKGIYN